MPVVFFNFLSISYKAECISITAFITLSFLLISIIMPFLLVFTKGGNSLYN